MKCISTVKRLKNMLLQLTSDAPLVRRAHGDHRCFLSHDSVSPDCLYQSSEGSGPNGSRFFEPDRRWQGVAIFAVNVVSKLCLQSVSK